MIKLALLAMSQYYKGRPKKIWQYRLLIFLSPLVYIWLGLTALMFWCIRENVRWLRADIGPRPIVLLVLDLAVFALLAHWLRAAAQRLKDSGRIVPYVKKPKSWNTSKETFAAGAAISAHCESLDSLAAQRGLVPISQFGFKDDRLWQTVKWHDPEEGLRSVTGLIAAVDGERSLYSEEERAEIVSDLRKWQLALEDARVQGIPFCLLIRLSDEWISPMEMDERVGTFW